MRHTGATLADCGATTNLTVHHAPAAWAKKAAGKPLTLNDFSGEQPLLTVLCQSRNNARGPAR